MLLASCASLGQRAPKFTQPRIVATFERLGLTAELPPITIYTPKTWGTFRISIAMVETIGNGNPSGEWEGAVSFVNAAGENKPPSPFFAAINTIGPQSGFGEFPIRAKAGKPIKFSVTAPIGGSEGSKYNVWVVVEQLM